MSGMQDVIIIGGGLAGLAAATALAEQGLRPLLLESRDRLGGRASSFEDARQGETIDNCQHVSMGCCTALAQWCRSVGIADLFRVEPELTFIGPEGQQCRFSADRLPAPFHLTRAFARLTYFSWGERFRLALGLRKLARTPAETLRGRSFLTWLQENGQGPRLQERFWHVVLVSAISETLDQIDAAHARKVFVDGFLANRRAWEVHIPQVPLGDLYGPRVQSRLAALGGEVRLLAGAERVELAGEGEAAGITLRNGERLEARDIVAAVPHHRVLDLLPESVAASPFFSRIARIESAPIASVHLWFDRPITDLPHATLIGTLSQWVFRRPSEDGPLEGSAHSNERAEAEGTAPRGAYYQVVISASRGVREQGQEATIAAVVEELSRVWPVARGARLLHGRVVIEQKAVFSARPGIDELRPPQTTPISGLHLAGDWTHTGWPSTMEGAVRSGYLAAESILRRRGAPRSILPPDLPVEPLARWAFGL